jgi:hypothetical protein
MKSIQPSNRPAKYKQADKNVEGIRTFSVEWGFSLEQIKEVRKTPDGAAAVDHGRVDPKKFVRAFNTLVNTVSDLPKGFASWKEFGESRRAKISDVELQEKKKLLMETAEAVRHAHTASGYFCAELDRWAREFPPLAVGRNATEIAQLLDVQIERTRTELKLKLNSIAQ